MLATLWNASSCKPLIVIILQSMANFQSMAFCLKNGVFIDDKALSYEYRNASRLYLAVGFCSISSLERWLLAFYLLLTRFA